MNRFRSRFDIDKGTAGKPELDIWPELELRTDELPQSPKESSQPRIGVSRHLIRPEGLYEITLTDGGEAVTHEIREQTALFNLDQLMLDATATDGCDEPAAKLNASRVRTRVRVIHRG
jgi:hypothetical protein